MGIISRAWFGLTDILDKVGDIIPPLGLRLILGWEYFESGLAKLQGGNWFGGIQENFPYPFNIIDPAISWQLATWTELLGGVLLAVGLLTRVTSLSLIILTVVATLAVHWPESWQTLGELWKGYAITDKGYGNFKLPLLFLLMLLPLLFSGPGKLSIDHLIRRSNRGF